MEGGLSLLFPLCVFCLVRFNVLFGFSYFQNKKSKHSLLEKDSFNVYSFKYFFEVLDRLTEKQKSVIVNYGFGCLLVFGKTHFVMHYIFFWHYLFLYLYFLAQTGTLCTVLGYLIV